MADPIHVVYVNDDDPDAAQQFADNFEALLQAYYIKYPSKTINGEEITFTEAQVE